ncbi:MAG: preprotein translocase subunit SecG [Bacteroidetes bacterium]|nr:preprotein translocase subunit SecG [Bacteroidota bacterium]
MFTFIIALIIIVCVLLVVVILAQNPKGGGLSSQFGGSGTSQIMGVKKTGDILEKTTWTLAIALLVLSLSTNLMISNVPEGGINSPNIEKAQEKTILPEFNQSLPLESTESSSGLESLEMEEAPDENEGQ